MLILGDINQKPKGSQEFPYFGDRIFKNYFELENRGIRKSVKQNIVRRLPKVFRKIKMAQNRVVWSEISVNYRTRILQIRCRFMI